MSRLLHALVVLLLALPLVGQDLQKARSALRTASKANALDERQPGIDAYVAALDTRGVKDLLDAAADVQKLLDSLDTAINKKGQEINKNWKSVDKQMAAGRAVSAGSVQGASKKHQEIALELETLAKRQVLEEAWQRALLHGAAALIGKLSPEDQGTWIQNLARDAARAKDSERAQIVTVLGALPGKGAVDVLSELLLRSDDVGMRVAVADALRTLDAPASIDALGKALTDDDAWSVRIAAVQALGAQSDARGMDFLINALAKEKGRIVDDIVQALEDLSGKSFSDNTTLWREWYDGKGKELAQLSRELPTKEKLDQARAMDEIANEGFLAGARTLVGLLGLGRRPAVASLDPVVIESARQAVGSALSNVKKRRIRDRNLDALLIDPFRAEKDLERRKAYLALLARVPAPAARFILTQFARHTDNDVAVIAIRGLGFQREPEAEGDQPARPLIMPLLDDLLSDPQKDDAIKLAAVEALSARAGFKDSAKTAVESLIRGLSSATPPVVTAGVAALEKITAESHGPTYTAWRDWWRTARDGFTPSAVVARVEEEGDDKAAQATTSFYGIDTRSKHLMFILDRSGSMTQADSKDGKARIDAAKAELIQAIRALPDDATFNIIFYNHEFDVWKKQMVVANVANKAAASKWITSVEAAGNTNVFDPIEHAFKLAGRGTHDKEYGIVLDTIFFLSDGQPNRGRIIDPEQILAEVKRMNSLMKVRLHTIGIGMGGAAAAMDPGQNAGFMRRLAEITGGTYISR